METKTIKETMKKSAFSAKNVYEYRKLIFPKPYLMDMEMEEEKEELILTYKAGDSKCLADIRNEDILTILAVLMSLETLQEGSKRYCFSMSPDNLFYNLNRQVRIKVRDIYPDGHGFEETDFLNSYKSLIGFALQKKYSFDDYKKGGKRLLSKNVLLNRIFEAKNPEAVYDILRNEYVRIETERHEKKLLLNRARYQGLLAAVVILGVLFIAAGVYTGYRFFKVDPYKNAVIEADNSYIAGDYVACIDAMKEIEVPNMEVHQKYILANAYIRSENLTQEQKNNILETISLKEAEVRLEYWIYLGRGETGQAVDIAMQQSDDQLLLYAYMKQKAVVESDTTISGEEKTQQLENINKKMAPLIERYDTEETNG